MELKQTLCSLVASIVIGVIGCENSNPSRTNKTATHYQQKAEERADVNHANLDYNRAQYLQLMQILENNTSILRNCGLEIEVDQYIKKAIGYQQSAEKRVSVYHANLDYNKPHKSFYRYLHA